LSQKIGAVESVLTAWVKAVPMPQQPDVEMLNPQSQNYNPDGYHRARAQFEQAAAAWQNVNQQLTYAQQARAEQAKLANEARLDEFARGEEYRLVQGDSAWGDAKVRDERDGKISALMKEKYGFTDEALASILDHRFIRAAWDLVQYHEMKNATAKGAAAVAKREPAPKLVRGGKEARPAAERTAGGQFASSAAKRLKETGSDDDAASFFLSKIRQGTIR